MMDSPRTPDVMVQFFSTMATGAVAQHPADVVRQSVTTLSASNANRLARS